MIAEADLFYPLETKLSDWYPATKKPKAMPKIDVKHTVAYIASSKNERYSWVSIFSLLIWNRFE